MIDLVEILSVVQQLLGNNRVCIVALNSSVVFGTGAPLIFPVGGATLG